MLLEYLHSSLLEAGLVIREWLDCAHKESLRFACTGSLFLADCTRYAVFCGCIGHMRGRLGEARVHVLGFGCVLAWHCPCVVRTLCKSLRLAESLCAYVLSIGVLIGAALWTRQE